MNELPNIISFSGGQTSGYMLRKLMDQNPNDFDSRFKVVFENTGKEHDKTLDFVHEVETKWGIEIVWLEYTRIPAIEIDPDLLPTYRKRNNLIKKQQAGEKTHWFNVVDYKTAARDSDTVTPFDEMLAGQNLLPNVRTRKCSVELKIRTRDRYIRSIGIRKFNSFIGIRSDEAHRKLEILANIDQYEIPNFPLIDNGTTKQDVDSFWNNHPFRLNIANYEGNCRMCFLKAYWKRTAVARHDPKSAQWWADQETKFEGKVRHVDAARFQAGKSYKSTIADALHPEFQFMAAVDEDDQDVPCSCAVGGYRATEEDEDEL